MKQSALKIILVDKNKRIVDVADGVISAFELLD